MEPWGNLVSFVRAAEALNFSEAARRLGVSSSAVSKNVAQLERNLGTRLFHRSTRRLTLTEVGERFYAEVVEHLDSIEAAIARVDEFRQVPAGRLRVSLSPSMGIDNVLPLLSEFNTLYPAVVPDWHFENRRVDLIAEGFDAAISGAVELMPGVVARELCKLHLVAVASPTFVKNNPVPKEPGELEALDGIVVRSTQSGRPRKWTMRCTDGSSYDVSLKPSFIMNDPEAICRCAAMGLGVTLAPLDRAYPYLQRGELVRLLPDWYVDLGSVVVYYSGQKLLPAKTRVFIDFLVDHFEKNLAPNFRAV
ncbi:LysR family transcriptional regulator [Marinobacter nanhaiticus D15-8W]|uniref:LysR family transcriptional regulator n=1 Tax=Marinobacter nanhaiticus D15-8W TaxID=626887 RepID=N6VV23_9GAMM|nr:LysR family transcriptional regulator [Marinobacter nanhaiticus]ENO14030.1 LysR family transcriptional regulator [Marinobacter nanhaiticus D15-8W]BES71410.1 LysR family transcriptional regulator [Marinobacter nanhaiticus D15-8W]